ncbi:UbiA-like polyprenyltransferase [Thermicanus aegyptius]|uniref:UbiA-like polyprenyltransferase n=1 Tax=Thermicanus aegyptius TaxID=94009 RepID=UPI00048E37C5
MIKFEHTLFALPFAYMGLILGNFYVEGTWPSFHEFIWTTVAMVGARSAAMSLNRVIDRVIDGKNPRTAKRAIPAGLISVAEVWLFIIVSFLLLFIAAFQLNLLAVKLLPLAVFVLVFYSYTKRFTWLSHLVLGVALGFAPLGGWIAATGRADGVALLLFATVALWTAGFDIIYATQDLDFDRKEGLYSIPARFGLLPSLWISRFFHFLSAVGFILILFFAHLHWLYGLGVLVAILLLIYEHAIISPYDMSRTNTAFFTMNGTLSTVVFLFTTLDLWLWFG